MKNEKESLSTLEKKFLKIIEDNNFPCPEKQHKFHPDRRWRFDFAYPGFMVAIEIEGGMYSQRVICHNCKTPVMKRLKNGALVPVFSGGRHLTAKGFAGDRVKYNTATQMGWEVYSLTSDMLKNGYAIELLEEIIKRKGIGL